jgi:uncharacterized protein
MKSGVVLITFFSVACLLEAQNPHVVRATGEATVNAKPDRVMISIGVLTEAATAVAASTENARLTNQSLQAVKAALGTNGEVKTAGYSITPDYVYTPNSSPKLTGYKAANSIEATVEDVSIVGKVIDAATNAGANNINGIVFTLKDDSEVRAQALAAAATKARANAEAIAKALDLRVTGVFQAESLEGVDVRPRAMQFAAASLAGKVATPIEAGNVEIQARVVVTLLIQ